LAADQSLKKKRILVSICPEKKQKLLDQLKNLEEKGWDIYATEGTHDFLSRHGVASRSVYKLSDQTEPNVETLISKHQIDLIINIPKSFGSSQRTDGFFMRRLAIDHHIPLITNLQIAYLLLYALNEIKPEKIPIKSYQEFLLK
ncbi:MAG: carbamoyl phosphate synthase large subunit, partial [Chlamydiales bacterium]|nr:carbamoyl phosphate synthase large subunit [Chlamydiales bacterium]